jgi:hypothetical protein
VEFDSVVLSRSEGAGLQLVAPGRVTGGELTIAGSPVAVAQRECHVDFDLERAVDDLEIVSCGDVDEAGDLSAAEPLPY